MSPCFQKFSLSCSVVMFPQRTKDPSRIISSSFVTPSVLFCLYLIWIRSDGFGKLRKDVFFYICHLLSLPRRPQRHSVASRLRWRGVGMGNGGGPGGQALWRHCGRTDGGESQEAGPARGAGTPVREPWDRVKGWEQWDIKGGWRLTDVIQLKNERKREGMGAG